MQFVQEPVDVEKGGGELVENERGAVEIEEGSLYQTGYFVSIETAPGLELRCCGRM